MNADQVSDAFDLLHDEISALVDGLGAGIAVAATQRDFNSVEELSAIAREVEAIAAEVNGIAARWEKLARRLASGGTKRPATRGKRNLGRLRPGQRTSQQAFWRPILTCLVRRGGRADVREVLDDLETELAGTFSAEDLAPLPSNPHMPRWRNTAQWARYEMAANGLLTRSPRGVWEISEAGRRWLADPAKNPQ